jgi:hypothetical protein
MGNWIPGITIWRFKNTIAKVHNHMTCSNPIHLTKTSSLQFTWKYSVPYSCTGILYVGPTIFPGKLDWAYKIWNIKEREQVENNWQLLYVLTLSTSQATLKVLLHLSGSVGENGSYIHSGNNSLDVISTGTWWWE